MKPLSLLTAIALLSSCNLKEQKHTNAQAANQGSLNVRTEFFDKDGKPVFTDSMKVWYHDSTAIEELATIKSVTDTLRRKTVSLVIDGYRYIDLKTKTWGFYKNFSDTSRLIKSGALPDTVFPDGGWVFYANHLQMKGEPELLPDTVIASITYRRIKFARLNPGPATYIIGYLRCGNNNLKLFSLEKIYSNKVNCVMTQFREFKEGELQPFALREVQLLSDTLSAKELKVFGAWKNN